MTARSMLEALLIELNKVNAPSLLLEDYNYFINKAINQYVNKTYSGLEIDQQYSDSTRVLKSSAILTPRKVISYKGKASEHLFGSTYVVDLPGDYLHMLNCVCIYKLNKRYKCYNKDSYWEAPATRLTSDSWGKIINDYYNRPTYKKPYFYLHNVNTSTTEPTNLYKGTYGTDQVIGYNDTSSDVYYVPMIGEYITKDGPISETSSLYVPICKALEETNISNFPIGVGSGKHIYVTKGENKYFGWVNLTNQSIEFVKSGGYNSNSPGVCELFAFLLNAGIEFPRTISLGEDLGSTVSLVDKPAYVRHSNPSIVRCEIRYGKDSSIFELQEVVIDYIKSPQNVCITLELMDLTEDTSQIMEFPDYVCQEIINELVHLVMENHSNHRLQTHIPVSTSIASPAQQLAAQ